MRRLFLNRRRLRLALHEHAGLPRPVPRFYARLPLQDGGFEHGFESHFFGVMVRNFAWLLAASRPVCDAAILHSRGFRSRTSGALVHTNSGQRFSRFSLVQNHFYSGLRFRRFVRSLGIAGFFAASLSGCASFVSSGQPLTPSSQTRAPSPVRKFDAQPRLGTVFFMPTSQVALISTGYVPAIVPGVPLVPEKPLLPILPPMTTTPLKIAATRPLVLQRTNPWHCTHLAPPCKAASGQGKVWWRCTRKVLHSPHYTITGNAAAFAGVKTARFRPVHNPINRTHPHTHE